MKRIPSLDGIRAVAITLVLAGHAVIAHIGAEPWWVVNYAYAGVLIFFVLSGYLITTLMRREGELDVRGFYARRAWRILPVVYAYLAVITLLRQFSFGEIALSWAMLTSVGASFPGFPWDLSHLWSLSVEEIFYLFWPLMLASGLRTAKVAAWAMLVLGPVFRFLLNKHGMYNAGLFSFPAVCDSLAAGSLMAIYAKELARIDHRKLGIAWVFAAAAPLLAVVPNPICHLAWPLFNVSVGAGILWAIAVKPRALNNPLASWMGAISYSLYVWHMPFFNFNLVRIPFPLNVVLAFAAACLSYYLIEQPILRWRKSLPGLAQAI